MTLKASEISAGDSFEEVLVEGTGAGLQPGERLWADREHRGETDRRQKS